MCGKGIRKKVPVECHCHWRSMKPMARTRLDAINFKKRILVWHLQKQIRYRNRSWENIVPFNWNRHLSWKDTHPNALARLTCSGTLRRPIHTTSFKKTAAMCPTRMWYNRPIGLAGFTADRHIEASNNHRITIAASNCTRSCQHAIDPPDWIAGCSRVRHIQIATERTLTVAAATCPRWVWPKPRNCIETRSGIIDQMAVPLF